MELGPFGGKMAKFKAEVWTNKPDSMLGSMSDQGI